MSFQATASQTVGPYFLLGLQPLYRTNIAAGTEGTPIQIRGLVLDGNGDPVIDACIEIWQANTHGRYSHPEDQQSATLEASFFGFARIPTDDNGRFVFTTVKPGRVPGPSGSLQAPHLSVGVLMRGLLKRAATRLYFPDEEAANADDPALQRVPAARRGSLIAQCVEEGSLSWTIRMQGPDETVFFDY